MAKIIPETILISGATGGIGSALAEIYSSPGKTLILAGRREEQLHEVALKCRNKGADVIFKAFDITDQALLETWLSEILKTKIIDLVIANAGISIGVSQQGNLESLPETMELFKVNISSVVQTIYPIVMQMRIRKKGQVAIMSSLAALRGLPQSPAYCASKAAIKVYGEALRALVKKEGVKVSVICPGFVKSLMSDKLIGPKPFLMPANQAAKIIKKKLQKGYSEITFPFWPSIIMKILNILPKNLVDNLLIKIKSYVNDSAKISN